MGRARVWLLLALVAFSAASREHSSAAAAEISLTRAGAAAASLVLAEDTPSTRFAAACLNERLQKMTGEALPVVALADAPAGQPVVVLAKLGVLPAGISLPRSDSTTWEGLQPWQREDAYTVRELTWRQSSALLLAGGSDRAVLYAVYDFLRRECGCGFFLSGEYLPSNPALSASVSNRLCYPRLPVRWTMTDQGTTVHYSAWAWSADDWRRHVDWSVAHRLRQIALPYGTPGQDRVWAEYGVAPRSQNPRDAEIAAPILERAAQAGLLWIVHGWEGEVPPGFKDKHPDHQYLEVKWIDFPSEWYLRPEDPLFAEILRKHVDGLARAYGRDRQLGMIWSGVYEEKVYGKDQEDRKALRTSFAQNVSRVLYAAHPEAAMMLDSWAFLNPVVWTPEMKQTFFKAFPAGRGPAMFDFASSTRPLYAETDYFWGNTWQYGWYYTDAPNTFMHESLAARMQEIRDLYHRGVGLQGLVSTMEVLEPNEVIPGLIGDLAWNPDLTLDEFLTEMIPRRYGPREAATMRKTWDLLTETVYGPFGEQRRVSADSTFAPAHLGEPQYHFRLGVITAGERGWHHPRYADRMNERLVVIPKLQVALRGALSARAALESNHWYQRDLVEWCRQLIAELFNQNLSRAERAVLAGQPEEFAFYRQRAERCLGLQTELLAGAATWPEYSFAAQRGQAQRAPLGGRSWDNVITWLAGSAGGEINDRHTDYYRMDRLESVRDYYAPRARAYLTFLAQKVAAGERTLPSAELAASQKIVDWTQFGAYSSLEGAGGLNDVYREIARQFAYEKVPQPVPYERLWTDRPVPVVAEVMRKVSAEGLAQLSPLAPVAK